MYPWQKVATDLIEFDKQNYVLVIDYYSRYIEVVGLQRTTSTAVNHMKSIFARHGLSDIVISDNGRQYASAKFESFSREYKFTHVTSSPMHSSGNGEAERAVRTIQSLLKSAKDPYIGILAIDRPEEDDLVGRHDTLLRIEYKAFFPSDLHQSQQILVMLRVVATIHDYVVCYADAAWCPGYDPVHRLLE